MNSDQGELVARAARVYIASMSTRLSSLSLLVWVLVAGPGAVWTAPLAQAQAEMYRYINAEGNPVIAYQVPPEYVANGYEILSPKGVLIAVVPRQLNSAEQRDLDSRQLTKREAEEEAKRLRKWDESLLLRYSTLADIEAARDRALRDLRIRVSVLKSKQRSLKQEVEQNQAVIADQERLGNAIGPEYFEKINELRSQLVYTERAIENRYAEIAEQNASYDADVERFTTLLDIVELRRSLSAGASANP